MSSPKAPPGDERVDRGKKSTKTDSAGQAATSATSASATQRLEKPGKQTESEHDKIAASGKGHTIKTSGGKE
jgi:hypothetical protein